MDINFIWVLIGCCLIGAGASAVGTFAFLRKQSLVGDAIAHSLLPGIALAFIIFKLKSPIYLFPGALVAGWLSLLSIEGITKYSKIKTDSAIAIVLSVFFAVGIVLLTHIQDAGYGNQAGLDAFLFGKAASMLPRDNQLFIAIDIALIATIALFYPYLKLYTFDPQFSKAVGLPVKRLNFLISTLTILAVASGIQAVGVVLMAALIITPAAAARFFTKRLSSMLFIAVLFGVLSAFIGVWISYSLPAMPTGPWIVVVLSFTAITAFIFAPRKGMYQRFIKRIQHQKKIIDENVVKVLFAITEATGGGAIKPQEITARRHFDSKKLQKSLSRLRNRSLLMETSDGIELTEKGEKEAARVVRLHRLWELYLNVRMNIAEDHVHHDADAIEHIITPELEQALIKELGYPLLDPHESIIPGIKKV